MKEVDYKDTDGRLWRARVPDDCPVDRYAEGIPVGPPALAALELPLELEIRLHNELHARKLFTLRDALRRPQDVTAALQATLKLDAQRIQSLYRDELGG
jgi:hypothetical protein